MTDFSIPLDTLRVGRNLSDLRSVEDALENLGLSPDDIVAFLSVRTQFGSAVTSPGGAVGFNSYWDGSAWKNIDTANTGQVLRVNAGNIEHYALSSGASPTATLRGTFGTTLAWVGAMTAAGVNLVTGSPTTNGIGLEGGGSWVTVFTNGQKRWRMKYADSIQSTLMPIDFMSSHDFDNATLNARIKPTATQVELHASNGVAVKAINGTSLAPITAQVGNFTSAATQGLVINLTDASGTYGHASSVAAYAYPDTGFIVTRAGATPHLSVFYNVALGREGASLAGNSQNANLVAWSSPARTVALRSDVPLGWSATTDPSGTLDTQLKRVSAGNLGVYQSNGTSLGTLWANTVKSSGMLALNSDGTGYGGIFTGANGFWDTDTLTFRSQIGTTRAVLNANAFSLSVPLAHAPYTFATVPSASTNTGATIRITDRAQRQAYSDGTNWRFVADDSIIS